MVLTLTSPADRVASRRGSNQVTTQKPGSMSRSSVLTLDVTPWHEAPAHPSLSLSAVSLRARSDPLRCAVAALALAWRSPACAEPLLRPGGASFAVWWASVHLCTSLLRSICSRSVPLGLRVCLQTVQLLASGPVRELGTAHVAAVPVRVRHVRVGVWRGRHAPWHVAPSAFSLQVSKFTCFVCV